MQMSIYGGAINPSPIKRKLDLLYIRHSLETLSDFYSFSMLTQNQYTKYSDAINNAKSNDNIADIMAEMRRHLK